MRRPVALLSVVAAILGTGIPSAHATPPPPKHFAVAPIPYVAGCTITPNATVVIGQEVVWTSYSDVTRTVTQREGFWDFDIGAHTKLHLRMHSAGTFREKCDQGPYKHVIKVPVRAPAKTNSSSFTVRWARSASPSGVRYSVRYFVGYTGFQIWKSGTGLRSATFHGAHGKTYYFEGRSIRSGKKTDWSPMMAVEVS
jgi:hypothetical protein